MSNTLRIESPVYLLDKSLRVLHLPTQFSNLTVNGHQGLIQD